MIKILPLIWGWLAMGLAMTAAWAWQRRSRNASMVDVVWTLGTGALGVAYALHANGPVARRVMISVVTAAWALRLGLHLLPRVWDVHEDRRYRQLRSQWGKYASLRFFLFFQSQAFASPLFAATMYIAGSAPGALGVADLTGLVLGLVAVGGEWLADYQLSMFRSETGGRDKVCDVGLWRYSRHPNYFFEWLHWWSYVFFAATSPWWWLTLGAPLTMYYFLNFVTGIPAAEAQALLSRGSDYRQYQRVTNAFFPGPRHVPCK